jgi:hypothetical protein
MHKIKLNVLLIFQKFNQCYFFSVVQFDETKRSLFYNESLKITKKNNKNVKICAPIFTNDSLHLHIFFLDKLCWLK